MSPLLIIPTILIVGVFVYLLSKRVDLGFAFLLLGELFNFTFGLNSQSIGGIHIGVLDFVSICLLVAGMVRTFHSLQRINITRLLAVGYLLVFAVSLARGIYANGLLTAANESRGFVGPLAAVLYFLTAPTDADSLRKYTRAYLVFGGLLCCVAILAAAGAPVGMTTWGNDAAAVDGRYLPSSAAAAIGTCAFLSLALSSQRSGIGLRQLLPFVFIVIAIYLRHRTVWMMLLAGVVLLLPLDARLFRRLLPAMLLSTVAVAVLAIYGSSVDGLVSENQFSYSTSNAQTLEWRLNGWKELLTDDQSPVSAIIGKSMGSGYWRVDPVSYQVITVAPHSEYVQQYLRVGILGMLCIVLLATRPLRPLWQLAKSNPGLLYPSTSAWVVMAVVTLVYGLTYTIEAHSYALLAIASSLAFGESPQSEPAIDASFDELQWPVIEGAAH